LTAARAGFVTKAVDPQPPGTAAPRPPPALLQLTRYPTPNGGLSAYVSPPPYTGGKKPAIVWLLGGFDNGIDDLMWVPADPANDQSARVFREAGIVLLVPSLRGGNDNPGRREILFGEVDDVLAAGDYVASLPYVDSTRIYLGGHSSGGTLALLVAEAAPTRFRAVFSFGPVADAGRYAGFIPSLADDAEARVRSPGRFLWAIRSPTFIIEGSMSPNARDLPTLSASAREAPVKTFAVKGADHFNVLAPVSVVLARKILADDADSSGITLTDAELTGVVRAPAPTQRGQRPR
jgi:dienelactone hydrolase